MSLKLVRYTTLETDTLLGIGVVYYTPLEIGAVLLLWKLVQYTTLEIDTLL